MLFNTLDYAKFFALVFCVSWLLARARKLRLIFILLASYYFYAYFSITEADKQHFSLWSLRYVFLIWGSSTADFLLGAAIARAEDPRSRKLWLSATVVMNLGVLGFFKYFNFGIDNARALLTSLGYHPSEIALRIALPVGISFFTFESMSYVIDVYRRHIPPHKSYLEYLAFVAFFPHLVAGPIVRPRDLLPQLANPPRWSSAESSEALWLIAFGLIKKVAIGDYLALNIVDRVFDAPTQYSALECYVAVVAYAVQIYCDFSGYTDIAIGSALLLGVRFPKNFDAPYTAASITEFWRRWHISLSTWLRDYLYIPLGGNRHGALRTYLNLMLTMLLGGLWHGANWTFVVWGGLHGAALTAHRLFGNFRARRGHSASDALWVRAVCVFATFHFVLVCWVFFRSENFAKAWTIFGQLGTLSTFHPNLHSKILLVLGAGLLSHFLPARWEIGLRDAFVKLPAAVQGVALFALALLLREMASLESVPFVYFQF